MGSSEQYKKWKEKNRTKYLAAKKRHYQKYKKRYIEAAKKWRIKNHKKHRAWWKKYRIKNLEKFRKDELFRWRRDRVKRLESAKKRHKERRLIVINHYGGKCACCGESTIEFLAIDHINNDGNKERKRRGNIGNHRFKDIINRKFPKNLQILCHNCNCAKGFYGKCPHKNN